MDHTHRGRSCNDIMDEMVICLLSGEGDTACKGNVCHNNTEGRQQDVTREMPAENCS